MSQREDPHRGGTPEPRCIVDPSTGRPILMAELRQQRPIYTAPGAADRPCPFCPGQEVQTPPEVAAVRTQGRPDTPGWSVRAFANKYPAAKHHEVIAEGAVHREQPAELPPAFWRSAIPVWQQRIAALEVLPGVRCAYLFKNVGGLAGASIAHNHSQLIGLSDLPPRIALELAQAARLGYCPVCATMADAGSRVVSEGPAHVALCPDPPKLPFETWLVPREHADDFLHTDVDSLAQVMHGLFTAVQHGLGSPPFNVWLHRAPGESFHWHFELQPRTGHLAGLELGGDMYINSMPAASAAARLRAGLLDDSPGR